MIASIGTYLPVWGRGNRRSAGHDEDAVTVAVAAGRSALAGAVDQAIDRVVLVTRDLPLMEGGNAAALLAGLGLPDDLDVVEQIGGATATLDALTSSPAGTLVIGADVLPTAGAAAAVIGGSGLAVTFRSRVHRSLPVVVRDQHGHVDDYGDPRLMRERGAGSVIAQSVAPTAVAGLSTKDARALGAAGQPSLPTTGASSTLFCLAAMAGGGGVLAAADQASVTSADVSGSSVVVRDERPAAEAPKVTMTPGPPIPVALPAYDRAFESKLRWRASRDRRTEALDLPPRPATAVKDANGRLEMVDLPRRAAVYTHSTVRVPVPGKATPYQLVIAELDGVGVRSTMATTGSASTLAVGDRGEVVFRLVADRSGVRDYGYAFRPDSTDQEVSA